MTGIADTKLKTYLGGLPGTSKTTCALSFPAIEQIIFGEGEEETRLNFSARTDLLPAKTFSWWDCLTDAEKAEMGADKTTEQRITELTEIGKYRNIAKFRKYIFATRLALDKGDRKDIQSIALDNLSPFADEFKSYVMIKYKQDFFTKEGNFDGRKFWPKYADELADTIRSFVALPLNVIVTCHVQFSLDEENAVKAVSPDAQKLQREWMPNIDGKLRFSLGGLFSYCFFLWAEETPGLPTKYYAKLEADEKSVGLAKSRFQPFANPRKIELPRNKFYEFLVENINRAKAAQSQGGK